jgi:hypothetical protein
MSDVFLEIVLNAADAAAAGIESRDEIEETLEGALAPGLGEVTGGGGGSGIYIIDVEIATEEQLPAALDVIRSVLREVQVPPSTMIKRHRPTEVVFPAYT